MLDSVAVCHCSDVRPCCLQLTITFCRTPTLPLLEELLSCLEEKPIQVYQRRKSRNSEMLTGDMIYDFYTKKSSEAASQVDESEPLAKNSDLEVDQGAAEASSAFSSSPNDVKYSAPACPIGPGNLIPSSPSCDESISS
ncbi:hypothetical protein Ancab_012246 [Ancistrocladus abbreviatus]